MQEFLESFIPEVKTSFGSQYKVIKEREAYTPPAPIMPTPEELHPDVDYAGAIKARWLEQEKMHEAEKRKIRLEEPKFYAFIWTHLTKRSQEVVERHPEFREIKEACDPVRLWQIVYEVHTVTPPSTIVEDRLRVENEWSAMKQGESETLDKWRERVIKYQEKRVRYQLPELSDSKIGSAFILNTNSRFKSLRDEIRRTIAGNAAANPEEFYPGSLEEAYL
jgi:hypothetical protein